MCGLAEARTEQYVGRWSRLVARDFLAWIAVAPGAAWLDVGCGPGTLSETILALAEPARIEGVDSSAAYIEYARDRVADPRARFVVGDAQRLPQASATCDVVVSGLVLNFVPRPEAAVAEMARVARPGGVVAAYVWDYADRMQLMRYFWDAAVSLNPAARDLDEGRRFPMCRARCAGDALARGGPGAGRIARDRRARPDSGTSTTTGRHFLAGRDRHRVSR